VQLHHSDKAKPALLYERRVWSGDYSLMSQDMQKAREKKLSDSGAKRIDEANPA
jgi:hypothetical protein